MTSATPGVTIRVQDFDFDVGAETAALSARCAVGDIGAISSFTGFVRQDGGLVALTLEHYPGMTERQLTTLANDACQRWPLLGVTIIHRYGRLPVGSQIVLVLSASAHRAAAFEACAFLMDWLKTQAPFWKQEEWSSGETRWVEAKASDDHAAARWRDAPAGGDKGA